MQAMNLKAADYWYHWGIIKKENQKIYDKITEEQIREEIERTKEGIETKIRELQVIINDSEVDPKTKGDIIYKQAELMIALPRLLRDGEDIINELRAGHQEENNQEGKQKTANDNPS
jgi:hypothetical protein